MKIRDWDHFRLSYRRTVAVACAVGVPPGLALGFVADRSFGEAAFVIGGVASLGFVYFVLSAPKRTIARAWLEQAREAPALAAASSVHLQTTGSKSRTILMLRSDQRELGRYLREMKRRVLLGVDPASALGGMEENVCSDSVSRLLASIARQGSHDLEDEGRELDGLVSAAALSDETRVPVFIAVAFFIPIMLTLFAAVSQDGSAVALATLIVVQAVALDLVFSFSSRKRGVAS